MLNSILMIIGLIILIILNSNNVISERPTIFQRVALIFSIGVIVFFIYRIIIIASNIYVAIKSIN